MANREEIIKATNWVIQTCLQFGTQIETAFNVGAAFATGLVQSENNRRLKSIGDVEMGCPGCGYICKVYDCIPDVDGDGSLGCPRCNRVMHERE